MKSVVKISGAIVLAASVVSAQIDQFPTCAYECLSQLNVIAGCGNTDYPCFCASNAFIEGFNPCISFACQPSDYQAVSDAAEGLCLGAGVPVTVTVEAPAATRTPPRELANFPGCARDCVSQLNAIAGCRETDFRCFCASNAFLAGFNPCISLLCDPQDFGATSDAAEELCANNGVTVTVTATFTPPPQPTSPPSSSAPAETTEPSETEPAETTGAEETEPAETTGPSETEPAETTGAEETEPAETTGAEETSEPAETSGPEETSAPAETTAPEETSPAETTMATVPATTAPPTTGNRTTTGAGSTPTTNGGATHTAFAGVLGAALFIGAILL
ncbi:hypothetical protein AOL_s00079g357 [Orbilia oligospora ATCC 24927]|uniref:CFEM domain-containing protein n=2 Tax=Orbilia oligospora TaxID=2813651 RepID=G1XDH2_ARTOA|nr:hypothetical protein AOL_s00079g357 [Orbilia oligospora ATCC 24927]EGX48718.1 hypothetical protein AOL_s00079g357 [Orbilia oligospora ATCC 24927]KAF3287423.1 hypothetical protein TWF970_007147 [Orbilia oligospora]